MTSYTNPSARTVFVLGRHVDGNREVVVVEAGSEYSMDLDTIVAYTDDSAEFPYVV